MKKNLNHLEQKSCPNLDEILEKLHPPPQNPDFEEISSLANRLSVPKIDHLAQIWIRFGKEMDQFSVPNLFQI